MSWWGILCVSHLRNKDYFLGLHFSKLFQTQAVGSNTMWPVSSFFIIRHTHMFTKGRDGTRVRNLGSWHSSGCYFDHAPKHWYRPQYFLMVYMMVHCSLPHCWNRSEIVWGTRQRVNLASKFPESQSDQAPVGVIYRCLIRLSTIYILYIE